MCDECVFYFDKDDCIENHYTLSASKAPTDHNRAGRGPGFDGY